MSDRSNAGVARRDLLRVLTLGGVTAATTTAAPLPPAVADSETYGEKRKARYQADSSEVQTFYRVNRYPTK